jgi:hypothetical protein
MQRRKKIKGKMLKEKGRKANQNGNIEVMGEIM